MDIAIMSMSLSQSQLGQQVSLAVMKKAMNQAEVSADGLTKMLESANVSAIQRAAQPHLGGTIDLKL
ncbi:YjfB family protein [Calidifontibacillus oryziterrae]|uniref:YjfB family protein n=1 Tax=Calidifontibacillus oryziterrae TaxID=1191699 RepID=UPI000307F2D0|nr:YjfB family protein [Calidifontibacillus oryziterrae]